MENSGEFEYQVGQKVELTPRERVVLLYRMLADHPMPHEELAVLLEISPEHVRQIESQTISKIRRGLAQEIPALYKCEAPRTRRM